MEIDGVIFNPMQFQSTYFESYIGVSERDGYMFRADVLTVPLDTTSKTESFHRYCSFLEHIPYIPGFQTLSKGFIRDSDHRGVLVWRHRQGLIHLKAPRAFELLRDNGNKMKFLS
jgi:hypothetical protein